MKTPREVLLARHRAAEPNLHAIRRRVVDDLNHQDATAPGGVTCFAVLCRCLTAPWRELIFPSRRIWAGLAVVWILIFAVNISLRDNVSSVTGRPVRSPAVMMSWQAQQRWMNELFADCSAPLEADRPRNIAPKPRTEKYKMMAA